MTTEGKGDSKMPDPMHGVDPHHLFRMIDGIPGILFRGRLDDDLSMDFLSGNSAKVTGYPMPELLKNYRKIMVEDDRQRVSEVIRNAFSKKKGYEVKYKIKHREGREVWMWEKGSFENTKPNIKYPVFDGVILDISELGDIEERILSASLEAEDRERRRLAKEIHDGVQQVLTSASFQLQAIEDEVKSLGKGPYRKYQKGLELLKSGLNEAHSIAHNLMPPAISDFGLVKALEGLIASVEESHDIQITFVNNFDEIRFPDSTELNIYRIVQEALNNVIRYAGADEVLIQIMRHEKLLILTIEDNGVGFDTEKITQQQNGLGIASMISRTNAISGNFDIASEPGVGTSIFVVIPLKE